LDVLYCSKHGLWSDSFHKEYLMVLPYLKGSLYIIVLFMVNVLVSLEFKRFIYEVLCVEFWYLGKWSPSVIECLTLKGEK
jgi:hypothetical protein